MVDVRLSSLMIGVLLFLMVFGCDTQSNRGYRGNVVEIVYSRGDTLRDGQWLKIDNYKFVHVQDVEDSKNVKHPLPTTHIVLDSVSSREFKTKVDPQSLSIHLAQQLGLINDQIKEEGKSQPTYDMGPSPLIRLRGTVRLSKSNSEPVTVQVSSKYPAEVQVLK